MILKEGGSIHVYKLFERKSQLKCVYFFGQMLHRHVLFATQVPSWVKVIPVSQCKFSDHPQFPVFLVIMIRWHPNNIRYIFQGKTTIWCNEFCPKMAGEIYNISRPFSLTFSTNGRNLKSAVEHYNLPCLLGSFEVGVFVFYRTLFTRMGDCFSDITTCSATCHQQPLPTGLTIVTLQRVPLQESPPTFTVIYFFSLRYAKENCVPKNYDCLFIPCDFPVNTQYQQHET